MAELSNTSPKTPEQYMRLALSQATFSPKKESNYRVGALLVHEPSHTVLATGYTLELEGNTHAEQVCFLKLAAQHGVDEADVGSVMQQGTVLYTTMEPCGFRLSGNLPCVERVIRTRSNGWNGISKVYQGIVEPETFVKENGSRRRLEQAGVEVVHVPGLEKEILEVATAGHVKENKGSAA